MSCCSLSDGGLLFAATFDAYSDPGTQTAKAEMLIAPPLLPYREKLKKALNAGKLPIMGSVLTRSR